jgi:apolipoprotein N-acyltransferase
LLYYSLHWLAYRDPVAALLMHKDARGVLRPTRQRLWRMFFWTFTVTLPMISWLLVNTGVHSYWSYIRELSAPYDDTVPCPRTSAP